MEKHNICAVEDRAAKKTEELLPCHTGVCGTDARGNGFHFAACPACYRSAVADELRKAYRLAELESESKESSWNHINLLEAEIARLRAENERLRDAIRTKEKMKLDACAEADELRAELAAKDKAKQSDTKS